MNAPPPSSRASRGRLTALVLLTLALAGCASVNPAATTTFSTAVAAARGQTQTAFASVQEITRTTAIDRAVEQAQLTPDVFEIVPSPQVVEGWNAVMDGVERYAQHLAALAGGGDPTPLDTAVGELAKELKVTSIQHAPKVNASLGAAVAAFADALLKARAQRQVAAAAAATDPEIRRVFTVLADRIGADDTTGLRGSSKENWDQCLGDLNLSFRGAPKELRRSIVVAYAKLLAEREACEVQLAQLRRTYLALADAHTALARGNDADVRTVVEFLSAELKHARDLQARYTKTLNP